MALNIEMEYQIKNLNRQQLCFFAWLCGLRVLPFLSVESTYWTKNNSQKLLYNIFYALDINAIVAFQYDFTADIAYDVAYAAKIDAANAEAYAKNYKAYDSIASIYIAASKIAVSDDPDSIYAYTIKTTEAAIISAKKFIGFDLENILFEDIKAIKDNALHTCNRNIGIYGKLWDDFKDDLNTIGCAYWAQFYEDLFNKGFYINQEQLKRHFGIPDEIKAKGAAVVGCYLERLGDKIELLNEARIIILGEKGAGKTSLARKILDINAEMPKDHESTEGVERHLWKFPDKDGISSINVHIWDFAGHSITHSAHRCFMSARCLYIYVYNGRIERDNDPAYWLEQIRIHSDDSPVLFLVNEQDMRISDIPKKTLKKEYPSIVDYYHVNIGNNDTTELEEFLRTIMDVVRNNPLWNSQVVSKEAYKIKSELHERFNKVNSPHITRKEFNEIAQNCGSFGESIEEILNDLHALGICLWYNDEKMEEFNMLVLNPDWITNGIYRIINKGHEQDTHILTVEKGIEILKNDKYYEYTQNTVEYLFRLMKLYELAFFKATDRIFIPGILPIDMPEYNELPDFNDANNRLRMEFVVEKVLPPNIVARIMVQCSSDLDEKLLWRKGAVLKYQGGNATALIVEGERRITVLVKGESKTPYMVKLRKMIKNIFDKYQVIKPDLLYEILVPENIMKISQDLSSTAIFPIVKEDIIRSHHEEGQDYLDPIYKKIPLEKTMEGYALEEIEKIADLSFLLIRLRPEVLKNYEIISIFSKNEITKMAVMSIDIRKSETLRQNAKNTEKYAKFISELSEGLYKIVKSNYGVPDKFMGDGILAYFPTFYSGKDEILNCCIAAQECHNFFDSFYYSNDINFDKVLKTGLGIGIDYGLVNLVKINKEKQIVGGAVNNACRFSAAPLGKTYLNVEAKRELINRGIYLEKTEIDVKEGVMVAYELLEKIDRKSIRIPDWIIRKD